MNRRDLFRRAALTSAATVAAKVAPAVASPSLDMPPVPGMRNIAGEIYTGGQPNIAALDSRYVFGTFRPDPQSIDDALRDMMVQLREDYH
jgi:hypothetical protein